MAIQVITRYEMILAATYRSHSWIFLTWKVDLAVLQRREKTSTLLKALRELCRLYFSIARIFYLVF